MKLKQRRAKKSTRGFYLQDFILNNTVFKVGSNYKYVIDVKHHKIIILPSESENDYTVSKRMTKYGEKPVMDMKKEEVKQFTNNFDYLQVTIYEDQVIVEGFNEEKENISSITSALSNIVKDTVSSAKKAFRRNVTDITHLLRVKKQCHMVLSAKSLEQAVGDYQQISFDELVEFDASCVSSSSIIHLKEAFQKIKLPLTVCSLFAGSGLLDKAFMDAGFDVIFALEIDKEACETYKYNIGNHIVQADITKFDKSRIPSSTVMIGGSPCQGFSNSNRYTHFLDNPKNLLVREYINSVKANKECKVFVLENVPQLLTAGDGQFLNEIKEELSDFEITSSVLCSADYGDPQLRDRAIVIGSKIGKIDLPEPTVQPGNYMTVRQAFEGLHDSIPNQLDFSKPKDETLERMKYVPQGGNIYDIPENIRPNGKHSDLYKRLMWDKASITIVNVRKATILHPVLNRILSIRECARLFGLKDSFIFKGTLASMQQQIANAVPWHLGYAVANSVKTAISKFNVTNCVATV